LLILIEEFTNNSDDLTRPEYDHNKVKRNGEK